MNDRERYRVCDMLVVGSGVIENVGNSSIALGAKYIIEEKNKVALVTMAGSSDLTGKSRSANLVHWSWDSWCLAHSTATSGQGTVAHENILLGPQ